MSEKAATCSLLDAFNSFNNSNSSASRKEREKLPNVDSGEGLLAAQDKDGFKLEEGRFRLASI